MAAIPHPARAHAAAAAVDMARQDAAVAALAHYARDDGAWITRADAQHVLDRIGDLRRAASAAIWLDDREAVANSKGAA